MSATTSAATGRCFGIQRVCQVWERSRSALYARRARAHHRVGAVPARRGPRPRQSDAQLLAAIRTDLARSPFHGEGHRKVHARLRILDGIRVARTRVLRVMRAHGLLSPHRGRQGAAKTHDGRVITQAPNVMWGTDGVRVFTLDDGIRGSWEPGVASTHSVTHDLKLTTPPHAPCTRHDRQPMRGGWPRRSPNDGVPIQDSLGSL